MVRTADPTWLNGASGTTPITLQHVEARWYQSNIGRFIQRDPIGLDGGLNLYLYVENLPLDRIDPQGFYWDYDDVVNSDGSTTRHFYDRGWTGWFKNEYQYSVNVPKGKTPPNPPRTTDQRVVSVVVATESGIASGIWRGAAVAPPGTKLEGAVICGAIGGIAGFFTGVIRELTME